MEDIKRHKIKLYFFTDGKIKTSSGAVSNSYDKDFYITTPLYKTIDVESYVNVFIDPSKLKIERQLINPYFIELDFFTNIECVLKENSVIKNSVEEKSSRYGIDINK